MVEDPKPLLSESLGASAPSPVLFSSSASPTLPSPQPARLLSPPLSRDRAAGRRRSGRERPRFEALARRVVGTPDVANYPNRWFDACASSRTPAAPFGWSIRLRAPGPRGAGARAPAGARERALRFLGGATGTRKAPRHCASHGRLHCRFQCLTGVFLRARLRGPAGCAREGSRARSPKFLLLFGHLPTCVAGCALCDWK